MISDETIMAEVVRPAGGLDKFRLVDYGDFKLIQHQEADGRYSDLVIEDNELAESVKSCLDRRGVRKVHWTNK